MRLIIGLIIPFIGTTLGASMVYLMRNKINNKVEKVLLGFASGVMVAASIWSLLIPSIDMAKEQKIIAWVPATIGFIFGIIFLLILDNIIPHLHVKSKEPEGLKSKLGKSAMMVLAVTLHNIPEGMAVGVALAGAISGNSTIDGVETNGLYTKINSYTGGEEITYNNANTNMRIPQNKDISNTVLMILIAEIVLLAILLIIYI